MDHISITLDDIFNVPFPHHDADMRTNYAKHIGRPTKIKALTSPHGGCTYPCEESFINLLHPYAQTQFSIQIARGFYYAYCLHYNLEF